MQYPPNTTGQAVTGMTFAEVAQSVCSTTGAIAGLGNNPKENISLGPLVDALLVYLNKG